MDYRGAILDVDGTVVRGDEAIPGAADGLDTLEAAGIDRLFFSNNPTKPAAAYEARFRRAGFSVTADEVLTAGTVTTRYLSSNHDTDRLFLVGEVGLREQLEAAGLTLVDEGDAADVVVASLDRSFDYDLLTETLGILSNPDVSFVGTDPDMVIPAANGNVPGSGAVIHAIAGVTGRDPDVVLGKPSDAAREMALSALGVRPESCLVVGDRLDTDIALGERAGMTTVLVRTGVTDASTLAVSDVRPDYVLDSLGDIHAVLDDR